MRWLIINAGLLSLLVDPGLARVWFGLDGVVANRQRAMFFLGVLNWEATGVDLSSAR